jgi:hypothetical protein
MNEYRVAAHGRGPGRSRSAQRLGAQLPEGKLHAYLRGTKTTACGFGLDRMETFEALRFSLMLPSARCRLCARVVGAADH